MFERLDQLIESLLSLYDGINKYLYEVENFQLINLRKKQIADIVEDATFWESILRYRKVMAIHQADVLQAVSQLQTDSNRITVRIKQLNSIQYKIARYSSGELHGRVAINKCLNDLFGIRIIIDCTFTHDELKNHIDDRFPSVKLTDATKNGYVASHVYIMPKNRMFPWELQVWKREDEGSNLESHKIYKQDYTTWENRYKNC